MIEITNDISTEGGFLFKNTQEQSYDSRQEDNLLQIHESCQKHER